jgi:integrase
VYQVVLKWDEYSGVGEATSHDLRRTVVTELLNGGLSYREVTKHCDPKTVMRYDRARENLERNPVNTFSHEEGKR